MRHLILACFALFAFLSCEEPSAISCCPDDNASPLDTFILPSRLNHFTYFGLTHNTPEACATQCEAPSECKFISDRASDEPAGLIACISKCRRDSDCPSGYLCACSDLACAFNSPDWTSSIEETCIPARALSRTSLDSLRRRNSLRAKLIPERRHELTRSCERQTFFKVYGLCYRTCQSDEECGPESFCRSGHCLLSCRNWRCPEGYFCRSSDRKRICSSNEPLELPF